MRKILESNSVQGNARRADLNVLVCILGALFLFHPMFTPGLPDSADGILHLYRTMLWQWAWDDGIFWPRWHTQLYQGYGYALMNFAPPLPYLISMAFSGLKQSVMIGYKVMIFIACLNYLLGMYLWARDLLGKSAALVAAFAYGFATFRFWELYYQGNYPQFLAWSLYPWALFFFRRLAVSPSRAYFAGAVLSFTALLWAHMISLMVFAPFLGLYVLYHAWANRRSPRWYIPFLALGLGVGVAAIFLLPALVETRYTQVRVLTEGFFDVAEHFTSLAELLAPTPKLDYRAFNPVLPSNFGQLHLVLAAIGALAILRRSVSTSTRMHLAYAAAIVPLLAFMMLPASLPVWRTVPIIEFAESPTRLFGPAFLFSSFLVGGAMLWLRPYQRVRSVAAAVLVVALILAVAPYQFPRNFIPVDLSAAGLLRFETEQVLGMTSAGEFLGLWATEPPEVPALAPDLSHLALVDAPSDVQAELTDTSAHELTLQTDATQATEVTVAQFYYPGWRAWIDGTERAISVEEGSGLIRLALPAGAHDVVLRFTDTPLRQLATALSILSLLALLFVVWKLTPRAEQRRVVQPIPNYAAPVALSLLLLTLMVVKVQWVGPRTNWFTMESPVGAALPAQHPSDATFGGRVRLLGYDLDTTTVRGGNDVNLRLYWQALEPLEDYAVSVQLVAGPDRLIMAQSDKLHPALVPMRRWTTEQYVVDEHHIHIPTTVPALEVRPTIGLYHAESGEVLDTKELSDPIGIVQNARRSDGLPVTVTTPSGADIQLLGYKMARYEEELEVTFFWQSDAQPTQDYQLFLHLLDANGETVTQADAPPVQGLYPTSMWQAGQLIGDIHHIPIPQGANPATLRIGMYDLTSFARLPATDTKGGVLPDNAVLLPLPSVEREE